MAKMIGVTRITEDHFEIVTAEHEYVVKHVEVFNGVTYDELWLITREDGTVTGAPSFLLAQESISREMG